MAPSSPASLAQRQQAWSLAPLPYALPFSMEAAGAPPPMDAQKKILQPSALPVLHSMGASSTSHGWRPDFFSAPPCSSSSSQQLIHLSLPWHFPLRAALSPLSSTSGRSHLPAAPCPFFFFHPADSLYCPRRERYFPWPSSPLAASFSFSPALRSSSTVKRRCSCSPDTSPCFLAASAARVPRARQTVQVGCCAANSTSGCPPGVCCFAQPRRRRRSPPVRPRQSLFDSASTLFSYD